MSHLRIFDNPKGRWLRGAQWSGLSVTGSLDPYVSEEAYEGRLQINGNIGDCSVVLTSGTLPNGYAVTVDQDTDEVVITWPAYQVLTGEGISVMLPNLNFELGDTNWDKGPGWTIQGGSGTIAGSYSGKFDDFGGHAYLLHQTRVPVTEGDSVTLTASVRQGASKRDNCEAAVRLEWFDSAGAFLSADEGNYVNSAFDGAVYPSTVTATAPVDAASFRVGAHAIRRKQNHALWVDSFTITTADGATIGTNGTDPISLCVEVTDSANRAAEWCGTINSGSAAAASLLASLLDYWDCDGDLENQKRPTGAFTGAGAASFPTGPGGVNQSAELAGMIKVAHGAGGAIGTDACFFGWVKVVGSGVSNRIVMGPSSTALGASQRWWVDVISSGAGIGTGLDDGSDSDQPEVSTASSAGSWYFCCSNLDFSGGTATLYVNGALIDTTSPPVDSVWADMTFMMVRANTGNDAIAPPDYIARVGFMERHITEEEVSYLYNLGVGKLFAEIVADAG